MRFWGEGHFNRRLASAQTSGYIPTMTVEEIKAAIPKLTLDERAELARCLHGWQDDEWDAQLKRDLAAGKLDKLLKKVDSDITQGNLSD
jgi:hypothetical protein